MTDRKTNPPVRQPVPSPDEDTLRKAPAPRGSPLPAAKPFASQPPGRRATGMVTLPKPAPAADVEESQSTMMMQSPYTAPPPARAAPQAPQGGNDEAATAFGIPAFQPEPEPPAEGESQSTMMMQSPFTEAPAPKKPSGSMPPARKPGAPQVPAPRAPEPSWATEAAVQTLPPQEESQSTMMLPSPYKQDAPTVPLGTKVPMPQVPVGRKLTMAAPALSAASDDDGESTMIKGPKPVFDSAQTLPQGQEGQSGSTVMLSAASLGLNQDPPESQAGSTVMLNASSLNLDQKEQESTVTGAPGSQAPRRGPGAASRAIMGLNNKEPVKVKASDLEGQAQADIQASLAKDPERKTRGLNAVMMAFTILLALVVVMKLVLGAGVPSDGDVRLLYPFPKGGGTLPNGRPALGPDEVIFSMTQKDVCDGEPCYHFVGTKDGTAFALELLIARGTDGWVLKSWGQPGTLNGDQVKKKE